jgi:hypothetical protein
LRGHVVDGERVELAVGGVGGRGEHGVGVVVEGGRGVDEAEDGGVDVTRDCVRGSCADGERLRGGRGGLGWGLGWGGGAEGAEEDGGEEAHGCSVKERIPQGCAGWVGAV